MAKGIKTAVAYLRTSSAANVGPDRDSEKRQRAAIAAFAKHACACELPPVFATALAFSN